MKSIVCLAILTPTLTAQAFQTGEGGACNSTTISVAPPQPGVPQVLAHPEVAPIFWGTWQNSEIGQILGSLQYLVNGPFFTQLAEYGSLGPVRMSPIVYTEFFSLPGSVSRTDMQDKVNQLIGTGAVPPPGQGSDMIYQLILPPGTVDSTWSGGYGHNWPWQCDANCGFYDGVSYTLSVINLPTSVVANQGLLASYSMMLSHELAEGVAGGVVLTCPGRVPGPNALQVTDVCDLGEVYANGFKEMAYWSNFYQKCVIPESYNWLVQYNGSPNNWTSLGGGWRQIAAGSAGIFATGTDDQIYKYTSTGWVSWGAPSSGFSMIAVGNGNVAALSLDSSTVWSNTGTGWTSFGAPHAFVTGLASGFLNVATDQTGEAYKHTGGTNWSNIGGPGDQFLVGADTVARITPDHSDVFLLANNTANWIDTAHRAGELYIGGVQAVAARDFDGDLYGVTTSNAGGTYISNGWNFCGSPGQMFALWGANSNLAGITPNLSAIYADPVSIESPATGWTRIGNAATRLIGHGASLYAAGGPNIN